MVDWEKIQKREQVIKLKYSCDDLLARKYIDEDSVDLDTAIEVLEALKAGKTPAEIPKYYDVVKPPEGIWDL